MAADNRLEHLIVIGTEKDISVKLNLEDLLLEFKTSGDRKLML